jgi:hypothetical protein
MAGLFYKVVRTSGQGIPLGAQANLDDFKIFFLDVGLCQAMLKFDLTPWFIDPINTFINKGELVEAFVGQEILAYSDPITNEGLFYWRREKRGSQAEIDYLVQIRNNVVPIEVKAGVSKRILSMQTFLETHQNSHYGILFSADHYGYKEKLHSYPLYAVLKPFYDVSENLQKAIKHLLGDS